MTTAPLPNAIEEQVSNLLKRGEHAAAAAALSAAGHPRRAGAIHEQIFEHRAALVAYEAGGDLVGAVRMAIELQDTTAIDRLVTVAIGAGQGDALLAALHKAGRAPEEARVHFARGDLARAASCFERAGMLDRAAECVEELGAAREAGLLLERHLELHPSDTEAGLRMGRILARYGRNDDAIATLQRAVRLAEDRPRALARAATTMMISFLQLGYEQAARAVLARWTAAHRALADGSDLESPPASFDEFMHSERAAALAAIQSARPEQKGAPASSGANDQGDLDALLGAGASPDLPSASSESAAPATTAPVTGADTLLLGGRYLLGEPIGGGGVGQVFRAYDAFSDRPVAVKIFGAQVLRSEAVQAFAREVRAFAGLGHAAVTPLVELNMAHGFVVTELITAPSLDERITTGGEPGWLVPSIRALLDLLAASHRTGLVHGGLKPTNVFLVPGGVRVVDVGAHRLLALRATETGGLASVWPYLSPEQLFGAPASVAGDLYAVGAMLYRALTGRPPFQHAEDDRREPAPLASSISAAVPPAWDQFLARVLHPKPDERFADADELAAAIPSLPSSFTLPAGAPLAVPRTSAVLGAATRYTKGGLVWRGEPAVRVYEGTDLMLERPVWLVEAERFEDLKNLVACARLWRGVQPVYDVIPDLQRVVVARDRVEVKADLVALRSVPHALMRDLGGVAVALARLHAQGLALGGFPLERALGPVGPRLKLAPAPLPLEANDDVTQRDWHSFGALVDEAFDLTPDATLDGRGRVLAMLHDKRLLDRADLEALGREAATLSEWPAFLDAVIARLVLGASARVVAKLVAGVVRGSA